MTKNYFNGLLNNMLMKKGAYMGALMAFLIYLLLPIYGDYGTAASLIPTGNAASDTGAFARYVNNLPFSMIIFFALEILGISLGIAAEMMLGKAYKMQQ